MREGSGSGSDRSEHEVGLKGPRCHEEVRVSLVKTASDPRILEADEILDWRGRRWAKVSIERPGRVVPLPDETSSPTDGSSEDARSK